MADTTAEVSGPAIAVEGARAMRSKHGLQESLQLRNQQDQKDPEDVNGDSSGEKTLEWLSCQSAGDNGAELRPFPLADPRSPDESKREEEQDAREAESLETDGVRCDSCIEVPQKALKSCLTCQVSYCQVHLRPHLENARFQKHRLVEPLCNIEGPACQGHGRPLELFCHVDRCCMCRACADEDHQGHQVAPLGEVRMQMEKELRQKEAEVEKVAVSAENAIVKLQDNVTSLKRSVADVFTLIGGQFSELEAAVVKAHKAMTESLEEDVRKATGQAEGVRLHLEQKSTDLKKIRAQMEKMSRNNNDIDFIQEYLQLKAGSLDFSLPGVYISLTEQLAAVSRVVVESTQELCEKLPSMYKEKLIKTHKREKLPIRSTMPVVVAEPHPQVREDFLKYGASLTFDPNTAHKFLRLTMENRRVTNCTPWQQSYSNSPERFEHWRQALAVESFCLGRHYFEVEAKGDGAHIGLTYKSINHKSEDSDGCITGNDFSWCLQWRSNGFSAWHADVEMPLAAKKFVRIGVFVDYDGGQLAFYGVTDSMMLLHQFRAEFLEPLHPAVWLPKKDGAILLLSPKEATTIEDSPLMSPPSTLSPSTTSPSSLSPSLQSPFT
ncbi:tripartite motif-containing protein 16-like protein [Brienomyrus brachyistius]|uniref:tripartite motif-containing protein 16-like protein n=1 Tax=Brienomyrus brachyistius TaxID=42636 RepID=UPI0020B40F90|nr:tripartite motif-containing protein 16-like protein [Brienomyrus brachyistius]